jgi:hypothetical protein
MYICIILGFRRYAIRAFVVLTSTQLPFSVTKFGPISANWALVLLRGSFLKMTEVANFFGCFFPRKKLHINFD